MLLTFVNKYFYKTALRLVGFTLIELLIVMAILAIVSTLGIYGFVSFRRTVQHSQATNEVLSVAKETRGLAKDNVIPKVTANQFNQFGTATNYVYGYNINYAQNKMNRSLCRRAVGSTATSWTCNVTQPENLKSEAVFEQISYVNNFSAACKEILFENLTGDLKVKINNIFEDKECTIKVKQNESGAETTIFFDGVSNTYGTR